jgi:soluble lytic murein transglycosylase
MSDEARGSDRWRYWDAIARLKLGDEERPTAVLDALSGEATYFGFLAADFLNRPYAICAQDARVTPQEMTAFRDQPLIRRIEALQAAGLSSWARFEWNKNVKQLPAGDRRLAAALATEQNRPDLAIFALSASEDRSLYEWRFPLNFAPLVKEEAGKRNIDPAWVLGLMRAESAMATDAVSPADARGLMQVLPGTAKQLARSNGYAYRGSDQLMQARDNIVFGTTFLRELMHKFNGNEMLVTGAYNAGPSAVKKWLDKLPGEDAATWIELVPFYETRDYIPRVLSFAAIYDWRLQQPVQRISSRLRAPDYAGVKPRTATYAEIACAGPDPVAAPAAAAGN